MNAVTLPIVLLLFLLPGFAWLLILGLVERLKLLGTVAFSFLLSLCLLSLTSAVLSLLTSRYLFYTEIIATGLPIVAVAAYLRQHGAKDLSVEWRDTSNVVLVCFGVYVVFLLGLFWSTPYYPTAPAVDALSHAQLTQIIASGDGRSVLLHTNYPVGLHFAAAILMTVVDTNALQTLRALASLMLMASLVLIFVSAQALFNDRRVASLVTFVGAFILPVDAVHLTLIGTYPNIVSDAIVFATIYLMFSYARQPRRSVGVTLALIGLAGVLIHSSILLFVTALWLIVPIVSVVFRRRPQTRRYLETCLYFSSGIAAAALAALSLVKGNVERLAGTYLITNFVGGASMSQLLQNLVVVYSALAYNMLFLVKPANLVAIAAGLFLVIVGKHRSFGQVLAVTWFTILILLSLMSEETDRFVLFSMLPAIFLVGNMLGNLPLHKSLKVAKFNSRVVLVAVLIVLVAFGGFLPLLPVAFNPSSRMHEQNVYDAMQWLQQNQCASGVASLGMESDFRFIPVLTTLQYSGSLPAQSTPGQVLQESTAMGFKCILMQTDNPNLESFVLNQAFREKYRNTEVAIFFITG